MDARGQPLADLQRVLLRFRLQRPAAGPTTVDAAPTSGGRYVASTGLLGIVGAYDVDVVVRRRRVDDQTTKFTSRPCCRGAGSPSLTRAGRRRRR